MLKQQFLTLAAMIAMMSPSVQADVLAAGSAYGGPSQTQAVCYIYNAGTGPVSITSRNIFREPNINLALAYVGCGGVLAAGSSCGIAANVANNVAHSCRFVVSPSGADVRGTFELRDAAARVLQNSDMR
jgi:hypothetical protein